MWAANRFLLELEARNVLKWTASVAVDLYGSLALTGHGHGTDKAVLLGLLGETPDKVDPDSVDELIESVRGSGSIRLYGQRAVPFTEEQHLRFHMDETMWKHPNGLRFTAYGVDDSVVHQQVYYSIGGGFVLSDEETEHQSDKPGSNVQLRHPFESCEELLEIGRQTGLSISDIVLENEKAWREEVEILEGLRQIWIAMDSCIERGCRERGILPGGLNVKRRAYGLRQHLVNDSEATQKDPLKVLDWVNLYALAVNEENAAGGRVVTAPTNGAAGVIPAVLAYYDRFVPDAHEEGIFTILLTASAIGMLYKENASISAAEVGCQGEVGVACSMAAGGLAAALGGSNEQIENAAEIGMEHNLGLTCDPIGGLVQIPCIERNTMGAVKAINAARLALHGDGTHKVSLDKVIETMRQTGADMQSKYKETSQGGLAVNVVNC